jgi:hypothetical protein
MGTSKAVGVSMHKSEKAVKKHASRKGLSRNCEDADALIVMISLNVLEYPLYGLLDVTTCSKMPIIATPGDTSYPLPRVINPDNCV